jgi:hypothetical protein
MNMEPSSSLNPFESSLHTAVGNAQPTPNPKYHAKVSSPSDGWVSPLLPRVKDSDAATLYSVASIRPVPVPIHQLSFRGQSEAMSPTAACNQRRPMVSFDGVTVGTAVSGGARVATDHPEEIEDAARSAYEKP